MTFIAGMITTDGRIRLLVRNEAGHTFTRTFSLM
jgi:hypothetical protein